MEFKAKELAQILSGTVEGDAEATVTTFARIETGKPGAISFYANPKYEKYVYESLSTIIIVNRDFVPAQPVQATMLRVDNAYEAVAALLDYVTAQKRSYKRHRGLLSRIRCSAKIGKRVYVGDFAYIGRRSKVGECTKIYEHVYIGDDVQIGHHCIIYPGVRIYSGTVIGNNVILQANCVVGSDGFGFAPTADGSYKKIEHTGNVIIEDNVELGANTTVDRSQMGSTIVRQGVKVDNLCQIAHNVEVGENTVMCAMSGIAGSTKVGKNCVIAGQAGIAGHLNIHDGSKFAAQTGMISNTKQPGQSYMGCPAIPYSEFMRSYAVFRKNGKAGLK
ncbi:MAG: UDP-3-O-(3-hydroxymyristoyl)glucosamine N-acyltransferase [Bacteroidales bacterium]|nr:UDP-3-O-(3-hydroxymyristoyl)glucosamine N-acyltransferase [Bacteroidales bacterium]